MTRSTLTSSFNRIAGQCPDQRMGDQTDILCQSQ